MNTIRVNRKSLGVNFTARGQSEILLWAPHAEEAALYLPESEETISLNKQEYGYWSCITAKIKPGDRYVFILDKKEYADPASLHQPDGVIGPSEVINLNNFNWSDQAWNNIPLSKYILYELHVGTFTNEGSLLAIEEKLDTYRNSASLLLN